MLTFWETRRGMQLADTLIRELPKMTKKKEVVQYAATLKCEDVHEYICRKLETGSRFVGVVNTKNGQLTVIMEQDKR